MVGANRLYLDNAATSFPKPPGVAEAVARFLRDSGGSAGRGAYREAREAGEIVAKCRRALTNLVGAPSADHVVFSLNCTDALNLAIRGVLEPVLMREQEAHLITTDMDHNSVLRPTRALEERWGGRLRVTRLDADPTTGAIDPADLRAALSPSTRLVAISHASNIAGTIQPIRAMGALCREAGVPFLVDAAQSMGHVPIDFEADAIDLLAFPGHKGLLGPLGTGGLIMRPGMERIIATVREGGTGSRSEHDAHPTDLPDKYEPGSHNLPGIAGLLAAVQWIAHQTVASIRAHEIELIEAFFGALRAEDGAMPAGLRILGPTDARHRIGVISVTIDGMPPSRVSDVLEDRFSVLTRSGLHCAPRAHRTFGTDPESAPAGCSGATRFSFGPFVTVDQARFAGDSLRTITREHAESAIGAAASNAG